MDPGRGRANNLNGRILAAARRPPCRRTLLTGRHGCWGTAGRHATAVVGCREAASRGWRPAVEVQGRAGAAPHPHVLHTKARPVTSWA